MEKATKADMERATETLQRCVREGDTLWVVLRSVTRGGRRLDVYGITPATHDTGCGTARRQIERSYLTSAIATVCGYRHSVTDWRKGSGLYVGGSGFDAGHEVVSAVAFKLFGRADALRAEWL